MKELTLSGSILFALMKDKKADSDQDKVRFVCMSDLINILSVQDPLHIQSSDGLGNQKNLVQNYAQVIQLKTVIVCS